MTPPKGGSGISAATSSGHHVTEDHIRQKLRAIFKDDLFVVKEPILDEDELITDLGLDSANFAVGLVVMQETLRVTFSHEDILNCRTFGDLITFISGRLPETGLPRLNSG
ncbi:MAG: phosphopantetheine-binding protein [Mycobacterium sp.]|uniref:phosphopantetheine-binding protein n=1 Tax=Mycobacterium sp. TaxID=1785 RepID=UPI003CC69CD3